MTSRILNLFLFILGLVCASVSHAATSVQVVATSPSGETVSLGRNQHFYLLLHYQSDQPVQIWARPYYQGNPAHAGSNPSRVYPAGSGKALGWFFLFNPGDQVDEIRITAGDGSYTRTSTVATYPVRVTASSQPAADEDKPEWVERLAALDNAAQKQAYTLHMNKPMSTGDVAMFNGFMLGILAIGILGFVAPVWGLWRWRGGWQMAAGVPAALMAFVLLRLTIDTARDPTSHNLWPFEILMTGALSAAIMFVLGRVRRFRGAGDEISCRTD